MITVISQTTSERNEETRQLFEQIKPLLDDGYGYMSALVQIGRVTKSESKCGHYRHAWFRDLKEYGEKMGYPYSVYSGRERK